jgi:hypothetical protein
MRLSNGVCAFLVAALVCPAHARLSSQQTGSKTIEKPAETYLGFDTNDYPGDAALPALKQTFAFAGYWLNPPPGEEPGDVTNTWKGKRAVLLQNGFGFLLLFNGRWDRELENEEHARSLGGNDAKEAAKAAKAEGFARGTVIFLDQEEGGAMLPEQMAYLLAWFDGVHSEGYRAGVYCSGMPVSEGGGDYAITANDIRDHLEGRKIEFFVYDDACPPAPGCVYGGQVPAPAESGIKFAVAWQYAQSPERHKFTRKCRMTYNPDGNCYPPAAAGAGLIMLDLDSATSPDPSNGRS